MPIANLILSRQEETIFWRELDDEVMIVSKDGEWLHVLNGLGAQIWKWTEPDTPLDAIMERICDGYEVSRDQAEIDLLDFVAQMEKMGLMMAKPLQPCQ